MHSLSNLLKDIFREEHSQDIKDVVESKILKLKCDQIKGVKIIEDIYWKKLSAKPKVYKIDDRYKKEITD